MAFRKHPGSPTARRSVRTLTRVLGIAMVLSLTVAIAHPGSIVKAYARPITLTQMLGPNWNASLLGQRTDLTYEHVGFYHGNLYLFRPDQATSSLFPLVVYFHGGSLLHGSAVIGPSAVSAHNWILSHLEAELIRRGVAFASVDYRLAPEYKWPAQIDDAKASIRYLRANAASLHIDPNRIVVIGDSAGGALASLVAVTADSHVFDSGPLLDVPSNVAGVVDMFGPVDRRYMADNWWINNGAKPHPVFGWLTPNVVNKTSAVSYVHPGCPPCLIVQGLDDTVVPAWVSEEFYNRLREDGDSAQLITVAHSEHEFMPHGGPISPSEDSLVESMANFITRTVQWPDSDVHDTALSDPPSQQAPTKEVR